MIVVADTSPLNYLVQLELQDILQQLHGQLLLPVEVARELTAAGAPIEVRSWATHLPSWIEIRKHTLSLQLELDGLDAGERAAIELAMEVSASMVLMDDLDARQIAQQHGIKVKGTLGILREAHLAKIIDGRAAYAALCARTNFYRSDQLERTFLASLP